MSETQTSVICPSCDEHFLIGVVDTDARAALVAAQKRIAELEAALRFYAESPALGEIARAVLAADEPAKE